MADPNFEIFLYPFIELANYSHSASSFTKLIKSLFLFSRNRNADEVQRILLYFDMFSVTM